ncbi:MAG: MFS transporter [Planctomycetaceae bacterium]
MSFDPRRADSRPTNIRWLVFGLGAGTSWMLNVHRYAFGMIMPLLTEEYGFTNEELGWLVASFQFSYAAFQFPIGVLADLWSPRILLSMMILARSTLLALHAYYPEFRILVWIRGGFGAAQAGTYAALTPLTRFWFPLGVRTRMQGLMGTTAGRLGGLSANFLFATVLIGYLGMGWQKAVYVLAAGGLALGIAFFLLVRDRPRQHPLIDAHEVRLIERGSPDVYPVRADEAPSEARKPRLSPLALLARLPSRSIGNVGLLSSAATCSTIADLVYSVWLPSFLRQVHGLTYAEMGIFASLPLLGGAIGGAYGGFLNDLILRVTGRRRWARSFVGAGGKTLAGVTLAAALLFYDRPYVFCGMLFVVKFFADWELASRWGCVTDIGRNAAASLSGFVNTIASVGGMGAAVMYGYVSENHGWTPVFLIAIGAYALCATSYLFVNAAMPLLRDERE